MKVKISINTIFWYVLWQTGLENEFLLPETFNLKVIYFTTYFMPNPPVSFIIKGFLNDFSNQKNTQKNIRQIKSARTIIFYFQFESYPSDPIKRG
ncbi:MAG: hypothetical protein AB2L24_13130 [Mangrovibacterium sp.]